MQWRLPDHPLLTRTYPLQQLPYSFPTNAADPSASPIKSSNEYFLRNVYAKSGCLPTVANMSKGTSTKAQLKAVNDKLKSNKFDEAIALAEEIIEREPKNYQARVFLGFSHDKKDDLTAAEKAYREAILLRPQDAQAFQGLIKLFEKQGDRKIKEYRESVEFLGQAFVHENDLYKAQDVVDKFVDFVRAHGGQEQYVDALGLMLPSSCLYESLQGRFPHPSRTLETIAQIREANEKKLINTLIGERRTRIGARLHDVSLEVKREVYDSSLLESTYIEFIQWSNDDEKRRVYEERLLQRCYEHLLVSTPGPQKESRRENVVKLARDMVIIKHPFRLAWEITIDWKDHRNISDWDISILRDFCLLFPETDLYKVITSFLTSKISPFPVFPDSSPETKLEKKAEDDESSDESDGGAPTAVVPLTDEDRLEMMTEGTTGSDSLFAYRLMGEYYQFLQDFESNAELMRNAMELLKKEQKKSGLSFENVSDAYSLYLGTALVYHQSPRHHDEARMLFNNVLERDPTSTPALIGVGLIYEEEEEFEQASDFLTRALERDQSNTRVRTEAAWVKALAGDCETAMGELEACVDLLRQQRPVNKELLALSQYRLGVCIWNLDTSKAARKSRDGAYSHFLAALKNDLNLAPAYASLGIYYADYSKDKKRARRCFQKAVELSSSEVVAAERLARSFADEGDWDRVELVAKRVVESGKVRPPPGSKRKGISWPFAALGVAELSKQDFMHAIVSFQAALRLSPGDHHCWVGLGESYFSSGRYMAATKAIVHARTLEDNVDTEIAGDTWFTKYMLANVKRDLGEFDESISLYQEVNAARPNEDGVVLALMQTVAESALDSVAKGVYGKAVELALEAISFATRTEQQISETFNFWKVLGEACSIFLSIQSRIDEFPVAEVESLLHRCSSDADTLFADIDKVSADVVLAKGLFPDDEKQGVNLTRCMHMAILCHKRAIHVSASDVHAQSVAYYNLGWAEYRAHLCMPSHLKKMSRYIRAAIRCFKRAIELEAGNSEFWNSLGVVTSLANPKVAQHAFVRSLHLNERSPVAWANLGTLALMQNDLELANGAFTRAQSNDPDYAPSWLGQGFVALLLGNAKEARGLFTHAMEISESTNLPIRQQYSASVFDHLLTNPSDMGTSKLIQPLYALAQAKTLHHSDLAYRHLYTLIQERIGDFDKSLRELESICSALESHYELTESPVSLGRYALAKVDLARSYLASAMYSEAVECGDTALGLTSDEAENELPKEQRKKARLAAHLTVGLALYFMGDAAAAITYFEDALKESDHNPDAVCLLTQVLWATGSDLSKEKAREALYSIVEEDPSHVQSVLLLGVVALLDNDEDSIQAVASELQALRVSGKLAGADRADVGRILRAIQSLRPDSTEDDALDEIHTEIMVYPHLPHGWKALAEHTGNEFAARNAVKLAYAGIPPRGTLQAEDLASALAGTGRVSDAQAAIFIAPWRAEGWNALDEAIEAAMEG